MKTTIKTLFQVLLPVMMIGGAYIVYTKTLGMSKPQLDMIYYAFYAIYIVGAAISWKFSRSREFFILLVLAVTFAAVKYSPYEVYPIISMLVPVNIAVFALFKERGILSMWGISRFGFIGLQILFAIWLVKPEQEKLLKLLSEDIIPVNLHSLTSTSVSQWSMIAFVAAFVIHIVRQISHKSSQNISLIGVLCAVLFVFHHQNEAMLYPIFFATSGIILITSIVQDSYSMAYSDELTGLPSRRALKHNMMTLGMNYVIAMLDIDHFKKFNDTYGHDIGDEVLKLVASTIKDVTGGGKAFRYGGEEFTIVFPGKSIQDVLPHLEELREKVSKKGFTPSAKGKSGKRAGGKSRSRSRSQRSKHTKQIYVTISIGVAQRNDKYKTPDAVMKSADTALYRAKKKGRNCVSK